MQVKSIPIRFLVELPQSVEPKLNLLEAPACAFLDPGGLEPGKLSLLSLGQSCLSPCYRSQAMHLLYFSSPPPLPRGIEGSLNSARVELGWGTLEWDFGGSPV